MIIRLSSLSSVNACFVCAYRADHDFVVRANGWILSYLATFEDAG